MYPDTDLPPKKVTEDRLAKIRAGLPAQFWILEKKYQELGVRIIVKSLSSSKYPPVFDYAVNEPNSV